MDTRFWGPSGWRLLHLISFAAPTLPQKSLQTFFKHLPYVLPCKFCRASLTDYYAADPIPADPADFPQWLYRVHNRVNAKLRDQKLLETTDPTWAAVEKQYRELGRAPCVRRRMVGWDFLFSVAYTTPCRSVASSPMPDAPPLAALTTPELRNRWGRMDRVERTKYIQAWWDVVPAVLPFEEWRAAWRRVVRAPPVVSRGRKAVTAWLYAAEKAVCGALKETAPHESFQGLCAELDAFSSGCGRKQRTRRLKTCRAVKATAREKLKTRRAWRGIGGTRGIL
jgi:hypothetical protein